MGYLSAHITTTGENGRTTRAEKARGQVLMERGLPLDVPEVDDAEHLFRAFHELGRVSPGLNGPVPLPWSEIAAYALATGEIGRPWEYRALREMSESFIEGRVVGENPFGIAPVDQE